MANATLFTHKGEVFKHTGLDEVLNHIKNNTRHSGYGMLRMYLADGKPKEAESYINSLQSFTVDDDLVVIEFRDVLKAQLNELKELLSKIEFTYTSFLNAFGTGYVAIIRIEQPADKSAVESVIKYYEDITSAKVDRSLMETPCYTSYDPDLYQNESCKVFKICNPANTVNPMLDLLADLVPIKVQNHSSPDDSHEVEAIVSPVSVVPALPSGLTSLFDTPTIPDEVFTSLPSILHDGCVIFKDKRERDVFLTGAIIVIGACMEKVYGLYDNRISFPNLYGFIVAPAANGKGVMDYSLKLGQGLDSKYQLQGQGTMKTLFIPGNISASMVIQMLNASNGKGIFYETEADTLVNSLSKEWGNFTDVVRKGFHSERISQARIGNSQFDVIENPRLSILLSGTPEQVKGLVSSTENGLFSRMGFYAFQSALKFKDVRPNRQINYVDLFNGLSEKVVAMEEFLGTNPTCFNFTDAQWDRFQLMYDKILSGLSNYVSSDLDGTVIRLGSIHFRISMILSALRKAESKSTETDIVCSDADFETGAMLASTYFEHAKIVYGLLTKTRKTIPLSSKQKLFDALPSGEFSRAKVKDIALNLNIGERSADDYLKEWAENGMLDKPNHGTYKKQ